MSRTKRQRIGILAVAVFVMAPALWAGDSQSRPRRPGNAAKGFSVLESSIQAWRAVLGSWLPLDRSVGSARHRSRGRGFGLSPTCDNGPLIDPNGHCAKAVPDFGPNQACDNGATIDPSGRCNAQ
jgi:hypothetical protein